MQTYEKKESWQTSQGRMKDATPQRQREGQRHLTGYAPSEQERADKTAPFEVARMDSSFGDVAVGVTGENKLVYTATQRRSDGGKATLEDEKSVRGDGGYRLSGTKNMAYTNPHNPEKSAVAIRDPGEKAPWFMRQRFAGMMDKKDLHSAQKTMAFLNPQQERKTQSNLVWQEEMARRSGDGMEAQALARERSRLGQVASEKEVQQRQFQQMLAKGQAAARAGEGTKWEPLPLRHGWDLEGTGLDDADKPEDEGTEENAKLF